MMDEVAASGGEHRVGRFHRLLVDLREFAGSPRFSQTLIEVIIFSALSMHAIRAFTGWPGAIAILVSLCVLAAASVHGLMGRFDRDRTLSASLVTFTSVIAISVLWSEYTWASVGGIAYSIAFIALGLYVTVARDTIQIIRGVGNALRAFLVVSFVFEVASGLLIDAPLRFLAIAGNLGDGGPIQGIGGSRNYLAFIGALALLTFWIEFRTRTVSVTTSTLSLAGAASAIILARSPVSWLVLTTVGIAGLILVGLRRLTPAARRATQGALAISAIVFVVVAWLSRAQLIELADATGDVSVRTSVWTSLEGYIGQNLILGWGWVGAWPTSVFPFSNVRDIAGNTPRSALNAYVDVTLQLGLAGLGLLVLVLGVAIGRAWLAASERRSSVHVWPALALVLLAAVSLTESYLLAEGGLLLAVVCAATASRGRRWRARRP